MWETVTGNAADLRAEADNLDVAMESCIALFMQRAKISEDEVREMMHKETTLSPQKALEYGFIDEIGLENLDKPENPDNSTLQQVLKENEALKKQLCNKSEHERQLAEFYQLTHKEADKPKSNDWGSFFN